MKFSFLVFILLSCTTLSAQYFGGIKAGTNGTLFLSDQIKSQKFDEIYQNGQGYQFGGEFGYHLFSIVGAKIEGSYQNNAFELVQTQLTDMLPDGTMQNNSSVEEVMRIKNGSIRFGGSMYLELGRLSLSAGPDLNYLFSSIGDVTRSFSIDSNMVDIEEEVAYDFLNDAIGEGGAYWNEDQDLGSYFQRLNYGANISFQYQLFRRLGVEVKTNYGFGDVLNDLYDFNASKTYYRQVEVLLSARYTFPVKFKKKEKEKKELLPEAE